MHEELYQLLRENEELRRRTYREVIRNISVTHYGEFTFFDGVVNRLQWERIERITDVVTISRKKFEDRDYDEYRRSNDCEWVDGGLTCEHSQSKRYRDLEEEFYKTFECFNNG